MIVVNIVIGQDLLSYCRLLFDDNDGDTFALQRALTEHGSECNCYGQLWSCVDEDLDEKQKRCAPTQLDELLRAIFYYYCSSKLEFA